jgi:hypothetical protein
MKELPLVLLLFIPVALVLYVLGRIVTRDRDMLEERKARLRYYIFESAGEELGLMLSSSYKFLQKLFQKKC